METIISKMIKKADKYQAKVQNGEPTVIAIEEQINACRTLMAELKAKKAKIVKYSKKIGKVDSTIVSLNLDELVDEVTYLLDISQIDAPYRIKYQNTCTEQELKESWAFFLISKLFKNDDDLFDKLFNRLQNGGYIDVALADIRKDATISQAVINLEKRGYAEVDEK